MTSPRLLVIEPSDHDTAARLGDWLTEAGAELDVVASARESLPESLDGYHGVVCLGGEMGAADDDTYPWLADIRRLLARAIAGRVPVLAVCLGAQLLALAGGGRVARSSTGPGAGPGLVAKRDLAWKDPLFGELPLMPDVQRFHRDAVEYLPSNAVVLASSPHCPNEAFRVGQSAYGLQFHIETTTRIVLDWACEAPDIAAVAKDISRERLDEVHADIAETWQPVAQRFVRLAAGELEPAEPVRGTLPMA